LRIYLFIFAHGFDEDVHRDVHRDVQQNRANTIIELIKENPKIRQQDIAKKLGVNAKTIYRQMSEMKEVSYVGRGVNGHWEVIHKK